MANFTGTLGSDSLVGGMDNDVVNALAGDDSLYGGAGNDSLSGGAGFDLLTGGAGNDTLNGGTGWDYAFYSDATAAVTVDLALGTASGAGVDTDTLIGMEGVSGSSFADTLIGSTGVDYLYGQDGNDSLSGAAGNDQLYGGAGDDRLDGGADTDMANYSNAGAAVHVNLATGAASGSASGTDTLVSIEMLYGSPYADTLLGGTANDFIAGHNGADSISGDAGNDTLAGGAGNDTLSGGSGSDTFNFGTLVGGKGSDGSAGSDTSVDTITDFAAGSGGDAIIFPGGFNNFVAGNPFASAHLRLTQSGNDTWVEVDTDGAVGTNSFRTIAILVNVAKDSLTPDNLNGYDPKVAVIPPTSGADALTGSSANDGIDGFSGDDTLSGLGGNDVLYGGAGNDVLQGGDGNDTLSGGAGNDTLDGGADSDVVSYAYATEPVTVNLALGTASGASIGTDTLIGIEIVQGGLFADSMTGGSGNDFLDGQEGMDTISAGAGSDTLLGGFGNDSLSGGEGSDNFDFSKLFGGKGDTSVDTITDFVVGSAGDVLTLPTGFVNFANGSNPFATGFARLTQSDNGTSVELDSDGPNGAKEFQKLAILSNVDKTTLVAANFGGFDPHATSTPTNSISGTSGNDALTSLAGNDAINGLGGLDVAIFSSIRTQYTVAATSTGHAISGPDGSDTLTSVERLQFSDMVLALDIDGNAGRGYRIYQAAFDRKPDAGGLKYWVGQIDAGMDQREVAARFIDSNEFRALYGSNPNNADFLTKVYNNVLHRAPDADGYSWWLGELNSGRYDKPWVLASFAESPENQAGVIGVIQNGIDLLL